LGLEEKPEESITTTKNILIKREDEMGKCNHYQGPERYLTAHEWAEKKMKTHKQVTCEKCGKLKWVKKGEEIMKEKEQVTEMMMDCLLCLYEKAPQAMTNTQIAMAQFTREDGRFLTRPISSLERHGYIERKKLNGRKGSISESSLTDDGVKLVEKYLNGSKVTTPEPVKVPEPEQAKSSPLQDQGMYFVAKLDKKGALKTIDFDKAQARANKIALDNPGVRVAVLKVTDICISKETIWSKVG
jgi:DNA-binding MarR family transcriptional regulator